VLAAALLATTAHADPAATQSEAKTRFKLTPHLGYRMGGSLEDRNTGQKYSLADNASYGLTLGIPWEPNTELEFWYSHQPTDIDLSPVGKSATTSFDLDVLHIGGTVMFEPRGNAVPYFLFTAGATRVSSSDPDIRSDTFPSLSVGGGWQFFAPAPGWRAFVVDEGTEVTWQGGQWQAAAGALPDRLGLGTAADPVNRLSVASPATLLSHEGAGHQLKVNKSATDDTASLLFQSGFTGHAEMGLAGEDAFSIKVSDGTDWTTALRFDPATGAASGAAVSDGPEDPNADALVRAEDGYLKGTILGTVTQEGGVPTGGVIERGSTANGDYVRFADGTQICTSGDIPTGPISNQAGALFQSNHLAWTFPAPFAPGYPPILTGESGNTGAWPTFAPHGVLSTGLKATALIAITVGLNLRLCAIGRWI